MTQKIHRKISKFGTKAPIVEKALTSFEHFYQAANKVDDNLIQKHGAQVAAQVNTHSIILVFLSFSLSSRPMLHHTQPNLHSRVLLMSMSHVPMLLKYPRQIP